MSGSFVAFQAASREAVGTWWGAMTAAGYADHGAPGPRPEYAPTNDRAFVTDPDGSSVEAVHIRPPRDDGTVLDHLWLRVADLAASTRFYDAVAVTVGYAIERLPGRTRIHGDGASFSVVEGEPTKAVHLAFSAVGPEAVRAFHTAGVTSGFESLGAPGERPEYHAGYFAAYLSDPGTTSKLSSTIADSGARRLAGGEPPRQLSSPAGLGFTLA